MSFPADPEAAQGPTACLPGGASQYAALWQTCCFHLGVPMPEAPALSMACFTGEGQPALVALPLFLKWPGGWT